MPKGDFTKTKEFIIPLRGVVRDGQLAALLDQSGQEIGMPVTAVESVTGMIKIFGPSRIALNTPQRGKRGGMLGDSRTATGISENTTFRSYGMPNGWPFLTKALCRSSFEWVYLGGVNGNTTQQMLARVGAAIDSDLDFCTVFGGVNDGWSTLADVDASLVNLYGIYNALIAAGVYVYALSEAPSPTGTTSWHRFAKYYNRKIQEFWSGKYWAGEYVDIWTPLVVSATGLGKAAYFNGDVHPNTGGNFEIAKIVSKRIEGWSNEPLRELVDDVNDVYNINPLSNQVYKNPLNTGSSGVVTGGNAANTGALPDNCSSAGTALCAYSISARGDGAGNDLCASITGTSGQNFQVSLNALSLSDLVVGGTYAIDASVEISSASNLNYLSFGIATSAGGLSCGGQVSASGALSVSTPIEMTMSTYEFTIPSGLSWASLQINALGKSASSWSATIKIGRISFRRIS